MSQCKQTKNESLRDYTKHFLENCATIANITKDDVIDRYHQGLFHIYIFKDFGRQRPRSIAELRDMMIKWAENEEKENDRFTKRADDNNGNKRSNDN